MNPVEKKKKKKTTTTTNFLLQQAKDMQACQKKKEAKICDDTCLNHNLLVSQKVKREKWSPRV